MTFRSTIFLSDRIGETQHFEGYSDKPPQKGDARRKYPRAAGSGTDDYIFRRRNADAARNHQTAPAGRKSQLHRRHPGLHRFSPRGQPRRPGQTRRDKYLVIHETDNFSAGADAAAHNSFIHQNANAESGIVSWHYTVDDHEIYHHLPDTETAYHAGDMMTEGGGNMNGIGIEMCVNEGGNYEQTLINTEKLCASLCIAYHLNPDKALKKHQDFMEKVCPAKLINSGRWDEFCAAVKERYTELKKAEANG